MGHINKMKNKLENIARQELNLATLDTRRSDELDFSDQAVWQIKKALQKAWEAGYNAGLKSFTNIMKVE